ncbi:MAG TPA: VacJ family lipoprotein [Vitreimonas sp.]|nr:VacJ family lipoprotein [Vitreimonas sp.]
MRGVLSVLGLAAVLAAPGIASAQEAQSDPWEGFNRDMFAVHESMDQAVLEPVARGYRAVTPRPVRRGVLNFLRNLRAPVIFVNDVLQGEVGRAGTTAARFGVNTTIGIAGVFDPATSMGLERHDEDFGQTLAVWGVDSGPYVFVPLLGPTTVRDGAGRLVDIALDPLTWAEFDDVDKVRVGRTVLAGVATRELVLETVDDIRRDSLDPYVTIRTSYGLLRESAIQNGPADVQDLPEFESVDELPASEEPEAPASGEDSQQSAPIQNTPHAVTLAKSFSVTTSLATAGDWK